MQVKLKWVNRNSLVVTNKIYRTATPVPSSELTTPIVELAGTITEWIDTTTVRGNTYYYTFATIYGTTTVYSSPVKVVVVYDNGPGPSALLYGDSRLGYFGQVAPGTFLTRDEVRLGVGLTAGTPNPTNISPLWDKWIRKGEIIYVPRLALVNLVLPSAIYQAGAYFGTDTSGPTWAQTAGFGTRVQDARVTKGFYTFKVRLATAGNDSVPNDYTIPDDATLDIRYNSEVSELMYPRISNWFTPYQKLRRCPDAGAVTAETGIDAITIERYKTGLFKGIVSSSTVATVVALNSVGYTTNTYWRPILILEQSKLLIREVTL